MNRIGQMVELVREAVTAPGINQRRGTWTPRGDCCMGSRIGHQLGLDPAAPYMEGVDEWAQLMGVNRAEVIAMLQDAGAGHDPLGPRRWPSCPEEVWRRLADSPEAPSLRGRDLTGVNLAGADLRGADLRGARLDRCSLHGARLDNGDLSHATMRESDLREASIRCVNLTGADLYRADLTLADLAKSNLRDVRVDRASVALAKLEQTRLGRSRRGPARGRRRRASGGPEEEQRREPQGVGE